MTIKPDAEQRAYARGGARQAKNWAQHHENIVGPLRAQIEELRRALNEKVQHELDEHPQCREQSKQ